ncbi:unnamed protein product [Caenorhabditis bovis]|uniref:Uncharacterized protein n=1 Tax=Caenorhabditis bovis TaxID=2654633 RepID=A0A8S1EMD4_9PELO|nr:unnamed protein product [Caenorhabditis bovis]
MLASLCCWLNSNKELDEVDDETECLVDDVVENDYTDNDGEPCRNHCEKMSESDDFESVGLQADASDAVSIHTNRRASSAAASSADEEMSELEGIDNESYCTSPWGDSPSPTTCSMTSGYQSKLDDTECDVDELSEESVVFGFN